MIPRLITTCATALMLLPLGCGLGEKDDPSKVPIEVKKAEMADSTRLDSAANAVIDSLIIDTTEDAE